MKGRRTGLREVPEGAGGREEGQEGGGIGLVVAQVRLHEKCEALEAAIVCEILLVGDIL